MSSLRMKLQQTLQTVESTKCWSPFWPSSTFKFTCLFKRLLSKIVTIYILELPQFFSSDPFKPQRDRHPLVREGGRGGESGSKFSVKYPGTLLVMFKDSEL